MRRFAHAAVFVVALATPVLTAVLIDHSVDSVLGAPGGGCSSACTVGGADLDNLGNAQGRHVKEGDSFSQSGTPGTGRITTGDPGVPGTQSGNHPKGVGHCTGYLETSC
jgi:hypothetical protein